MNLLKRITGILLAAVMVTLSCVPAFAAGGYTETSGLAIPDALQKNLYSDEHYVDIRMFSADDDGNLELIVDVSKDNGRRQGSTDNFLQYSSRDGGKSWTETPLAWMKSDYENTNTPFVMHSDGAIYGMLNTPEHYREPNNMGGTSGYPAFELNKVMNGVKQVIPNSQIIGKEFDIPFLLGITAQGDAVIDVGRFGIVRDRSSLKPMILVLDGKTGARKALWEIDNSFHYYADGKIFTTQKMKADAQTTRSFTVYDLLTGKKLKTVSCPKGVSGIRTVATDGSVYLVGRQGLYRLASDTNVFVKVMDATKSATDAGWCAISPNGTLYVFWKYDNRDKPDDPKNGTITAFSRYSPT